MKVIEQFYDVKTGKGGRREVERPDVITEEEGIRRDAIAAAAARRNARMAEIREQLLEQHLMGLPLDPKLQAEYSAMKRDI